MRVAAIGAIALGLAAAATTSALAGQSDGGSPDAKGFAGKPSARKQLGGQNFTKDSTGASAKGVAPSGKFRAAPDQGVQNSYIVVLKNTKASQAQVTDAAGTLSKRHNGKVGKVWANSVRGFSVELSDADAQALAQDPDVSYVEQNRLIHQTAVEGTRSAYADPNGYHWNMWGLDRIDQPFATADHQYHYPSAPVTDVNVYVIDTGINWNHQEFANNPAKGQGWSATWTPEQIKACVSPMANGVDDDGHGTFVAGEIAGQTFGVTRNSPIYPVKVLDCKGQGTTAEVIEGINHVVSTAVKPAVANMSLGGAADSAIDDAVHAAVAGGITFVVAAGNDGTDACTESPSRVPDAITVGATDQTDFAASFSNYGSCVDILAPGVNIGGADFGQVNGSAWASGTSMAAPLVTGAAALLLHQHANWTPAQVHDKLIANSIAGTVRAAGPGTTTRLLRVADADTDTATVPTSFSLRAHANQKIVTAESAGTQPLIANRYNAGSWEGITVVPAGDGTHVALKSSANNLYVTAESAGAAPLIANRPAVGAWEKFTLVANADGSYSLQAAVNGMYVTAESGGASALIANRPAIGTWEKFDLAGPAAAVFFQANANFYAVTAESAGAQPLIANRPGDAHYPMYIGNWEKFDVVDAGGSAGLQAHANGLFVTADAGGTKPLIASHSTIGAADPFTLINVPGGGLSFLSHANGEIVTAESAGNLPLIANRTAIGSWEIFYLTTTDELQP